MWVNPGLIPCFAVNSGHGYSLSGSGTAMVSTAMFFYTFKGGPNFINLWDGDYGQFYMVLPHEPCVIENGYYSITVKQWVYVVVKNDWYYIV